jgi:hypothetical protein
VDPCFHTETFNWKRGVHDIEHQITYEGSNFIFHDSQGFESGGREELEVVWDFIEKRSTAAKLKNQLHAIWYLSYLLSIQIADLSFNRYCIPMDSSRPILPTELDFFSKGTGKGEASALSVWPTMTNCYIHSSFGNYIHQV